MQHPLGFGDLRGKTVVITGGAGVLCTAFAQAYAGVGAKVALLDLDGEPVHSVRDLFAVLSTRSGAAATGNGKKGRTE